MITLESPVSRLESFARHSADVAHCTLNYAFDSADPTSAPEEHGRAVAASLQPLPDYLQEMEALPGSAALGGA